MRWASDVRGVARDSRVRPLSTHKKRRSSWTLQSKRLLSEERLILPPSVDITLLCSIRDLLLREANCRALLQKVIPWTESFNSSLPVDGWASWETLAPTLAVNISLSRASPISGSAIEARESLSNSWLEVTKNSSSVCCGVETFVGSSCVASSLSNSWLEVTKNSSSVCCGVETFVGSSCVASSLSNSWLEVTKNWSSVCCGVETLVGSPWVASSGWSVCSGSSESFVSDFNSFWDRSALDPTTSVAAGFGGSRKTLLLRETLLPKKPSFEWPWSVVSGF